MKTKFGLPLANADNVFEVLRSLGIVRWDKVGNPMSVTDYLKENLDEEEKRGLKYLPRVEVVGFNVPGARPFRGFQLSGIHGVRVFTLIDGFVPICGEFQHGCEDIILDLPGGHIEDEEDHAVCAKREFEEEVGLTLEKVVPLGLRGMTINARRTKARNFSFIGTLKKPIVCKSQRLDGNEHLRVVLVSLEDWLKLIEQEFVQSFSVATTLLALRRGKNFIDVNARIYVAGHESDI